MIQLTATSGPVNTEHRTEIEYEDGCLRIGLVKRPPSFGIVNVNRWTFELSERGDFLSVDSWFPARPIATWNREIVAYTAATEVRLLPRLDKNRHDSYHVPEMTFVNRSGRTLYILWLQQAAVHRLHCFVYSRHLSFLTSASNPQGELFGIMVHGLPAACDKVLTSHA